MAGLPVRLSSSDLESTCFSPPPSSAVSSEMLEARPLAGPGEEPPHAQNSVRCPSCKEPMALSGSVLERVAAELEGEPAADGGGNEAKAVLLQCPLNSCKRNKNFNSRQSDNHQFN